MLERLRARRASLPPAERRVADLVLAHPEGILQAPISKIAERAGVSQPTVVRFCRSLDCRGLSDFKLRLARATHGGTPFVHSDVSPGDSIADIAAKVFDNTLSGLARARSDLDLNAIERAAELLAGARRVEFYGLGNSGITALDAQHKLFRLGISCVAYNDSHVQGMAATLVEAGDVVVAISASGRTIDIVRAVEVARESGAATIAITRSGSPLAGAADLLLVAQAEEEDPDIYSPMITRLIHLAIIDVLTVAVAIRGGGKVSARLARTKQTLQQRRLRA